MQLLLAIPGVTGIVYQAYSRNSLTPLGLAAAALTAIAYNLHPFSVPFGLLVAFFVGGMKITTISSNHENLG